VLAWFGFASGLLVAPLAVVAFFAHALELGRISFVQFTLTFVARILVANACSRFVLTELAVKFQRTGTDRIARWQIHHALGLLFARIFRITGRFLWVASSVVTEFAFVLGRETRISPRFASAHRCDQIAHIQLFHLACAVVIARIRIANAFLCLFLAVSAVMSGNALAQRLIPLAHRTLAAILARILFARVFRLAEVAQIAGRTRAHLLVTNHTALAFAARVWRTQIDLSR